VPDRDVKLFVVGEPALGLQFLERGIVDAVPLSMPLNLAARKLGFRELVNYEKLDIAYPSNTVTTLKQTASKNPELIERFLKTLIEGIHIFKTQKEKSLAVMRKNLRGGSEEVLEETYQNTVDEMESVPTPRLQVIKSGLDLLSLQYPRQSKPMLTRSSTHPSSGESSKADLSPRSRRSDEWKATPTSTSTEAAHGFPIKPQPGRFGRLERFSARCYRLIKK
jgi:ABC-type nitrate/sulfonate/bicarbonate transport system substrate-binding protein